MAESKRNHSLDFLKGIACIFVVFMHCEFPGTMGIVVQCISRFCVPVFFMISGYFCYSTSKSTDYGRKIRHIVGITVTACVIYIFVALVQGIVLPSASDVFDWLVFNRPIIVTSQLWFLFALLYDYILFAICEKLNLRKLVYISIPLLIIAYIFMAQGLHLMGVSIHNMYYRNFLIEGFPLFSLGFWIHEHQDKINISNKVLIAVLVISTLLCPVERFLMGRDFGVNIVTFPQVISLFLLCLKNPVYGEGKRLTKLGADYSMYVYIFHPAVWRLLDKIYSILSLSGISAMMYLRPVLCVIITILLSVIFRPLNRKVHSKLSKKKE